MMTLADFFTVFVRTRPMFAVFVEEGRERGVVVELKSGRKESRCRCEILRVAFPDVGDFRLACKSGT